MSSRVDGMTPEWLIRCRVAPDARGAAGRLNLEIDGHAHTASLRVDRLSRRLVSNLPDRIVDLLEIAAYVYAADAAISRGGLTDRQMGAAWRRRMSFEIPVRRPDLWRNDNIRHALEETLSLLSDDEYEFTFVSHDALPAGTRYFGFATEEGFAADEVLLFSGGLDSFAGALEELLGQRHRVVLVSHHGAVNMARVQRELASDLRKRAGDGRLLHVPVTLQMGSRSNRESTHRTRSFFFAALGVATARMFGLSRLRFYENGVVSLNLPPSGQVVGSRATRSTHPQVLATFGQLFSAVFDAPIEVHNPARWKTKADVVSTIRDLGAQDLIRFTRSCGEVRKMTHAHPHCGLCSQCIDRRFAVLATGIEQEDPEEAYAVDPLCGARSDVRERELALGYVRNARRFATMSPRDFVQAFGELQRAVGFMGEPAGAAANRYYLLHKRHGEAVSRVLDSAMDQARFSSSAVDSKFHPESLVMLAGRDVYAGSHSSLSAGPASLPQRNEKLSTTQRWTLHVGSKRVGIDNLGSLGGIAATVLSDLSAPHLEAAGQGLILEDYPLIPARELAARWDVGEEVVRKRISRTRNEIRRLATRAGREAPDIDEIVESVGWHGYRLNPDNVTVHLTGQE